MENVKKWHYDFILEIFGLVLGIKGRINFLQLSRFGKHTEQRYRNQIEKSFDFLMFNKKLIKEYGSGHYTIAFDPSYVSKSSKSTPGVGWYWSGVAGAAKWGLEIGGIGAIDIGNHTGFHIEAVQTSNSLESKSLLDHYGDVIIQRKKQLQQLSKYVVADAYFSKKPFVLKICDNGFDIVCRLRDDASLQYEYKGEKSKTRGRPRKFEGKVDFKNLEKKHFTVIENNKENKIYSARVHSKSLDRFINLAIVYTSKKGKWKHKLYFSTDLEIDTKILLKYYQLDFKSNLPIETQNNLQDSMIVKPEVKINCIFTSTQYSQL